MTKKINLITIGADSEVFYMNTKTKEIISAEGIIRGSKYDPEPFYEDKQKGYALSLDNVMPEFCIPPAKTADEFAEYLQTGIDYVNSIAPKDICISIQAAANLNEKWLQTYIAQTFGCEPDFNAYSMAMNDKPQAKDSTLRSAAAHIHFGYEDAAPFDGDIEEYTPIEEHTRIVQSADLHLSIPAVLMEEDNKRKELYGKAGAYRPKSYGLEYRTISNFYLKSKELMKWAFDAAKQSVEALNNGLVIDGGLRNIIQSTIDNNDKKMAEELVKEFNLQLL